MTTNQLTKKDHPDQLAGDGMALMNILPLEGTKLSTTTVPQDTVSQPTQQATEDSSLRYEEVHQLIGGYVANRDRNMHAAPLDHGWDGHAHVWAPPEHDGNWCNRLDCTVAPRVIADGRAIWNVGMHRTYTRVLTTAYGDVAAIAIGLPHESDGPDFAGACVHFHVRAQDHESETDDAYAANLTADEADELAEALRSRAAELRRMLKARAEDEDARAAEAAR